MVGRMGRRGVPINRGNSGGPLFNLQGQVIGVNSQIYSTSGGYQGLSFSIPIDVAMNVVQQIKDKAVVHVDNTAAEHEVLKATLAAMQEHEARTEPERARGMIDEATADDA